MSNRLAIMAGLTIDRICPSILARHRRAVAEILACINSDPGRLRAHRRAKLSTFPEADRDLIRQHTNAIIIARR